MNRHKNDNTAFFILLSLIAIFVTAVGLSLKHKKAMDAKRKHKTVDTVYVAKGIDTLYIKR